MIYYIDMGTTNIRVYEFETKKLIYNGVEGVLFFNDGTHFNTNKFTNFIEERLDLKGKKIFMSGMIGSNLGLCFTEYISFSKLFKLKVNNLTKKKINTNEFFIFPGVRFESDIMRGEEMELLGVVKKHNMDKYETILFPGTHAKLVTVKDGKIIKFSTLFTGELIKLVIDNSTLFKGSDVNISSIDIDNLVRIDESLIESIFKCRALQILGEASETEALEHLLSIIYTEETNLLTEYKSLIVCDENRRNFYEKYGSYNYELDVMSLEGFKYFYENNTDYFNTIYK